MRPENVEPFDDEEAELIRSVEAGEWVPVENADLEVYRETARATLRKDQRINIRLTRGDLFQLKAVAAEEGMPYQTLIASVLHKYVTGRLVDRGRASLVADSSENTYGGK
jgi:predicted DNA binding CopG/RHH family protein